MRYRKQRSYKRLLFHLKMITGPVQSPTSETFTRQSPFFPCENVQASSSQGQYINIHSVFIKSVCMNQTIHFYEVSSGANPPPSSVILFLFLIFLHICTDLTHSLLRIEVNLTFLVSVPIGLINFVFLQLNGSTKPHFYSFFAQLWYFQPAFLTPLLVFLTFLFLAAMVNKNENLLPLLHTELGLVISQVQLQGTGR